MKSKDMQASNKCAKWLLRLSNYSVFSIPNLQKFLLLCLPVMHGQNSSEIHQARQYLNVSTIEIKDTRILAIGRGDLPPRAGYTANKPNPSGGNSRSTGLPPSELRPCPLRHR